ncbi:hypothetical protein [Maribacter sp. HTCC2170]|uniref:hypothetical protein n=1 Tax=Maribacter sp. (strain HTCC2170 / KCCM 42371) TaxID=313603 RepID=UPI0002F8732C|nr:hypothetical protein [Maribacter sp. HTCC2170]
MGIALNLPESDITYYPDFIPKNLDDTYLKVFTHRLPWQQDDIKVFGKVYPQPRLTSLH